MGKTVTADFDEKRDEILRTAASVFAETGFDRASMSELAKVCKVSKAGLYHYFPKKNSILFVILDRHLVGLSEHVCALERGKRSNEEFLEYLIEEILLFYRGKDSIHKLQIQALGQLEQDDQEKLKKHMRKLVEEVANAIVAIDPDRFPDHNKKRMAVMSLFGMLNWYFTWNSGRGVEGRREYARFVTRIMLSGAYR